MARALIANIRKETRGDDLVVSWDVEFFGNDLARNDLTTCTATIPEAATLAQASVLIRNAIQDEATRIGIAWNGRANRLDDLFVGV